MEVADEELGLDAQRNVPDRVILLARPPLERTSESRERTAPSRGTGVTRSIDKASPPRDVTPGQALTAT